MSYVAAKPNAQEQSPRGVLLRSGVLRVCCGFSGAHPGMGVISSCKAALLRLRFCVVVLMWICFVFVWRLSWRTPLEDCF